jgi:hypothetical protein
MQAAAQTIDRYGLTRHHRNNHAANIDRFYARAEASAYTSEAACHYPSPLTAISMSSTQSALAGLAAWRRRRTTPQPAA